MLCNGDHLPAVNNIIYSVRQALVQCYWGPKSGFHHEQQPWHRAWGWSWEPQRKVEMCPAHPIQLIVSGLRPKVLVGQSLLSVFLAQLGLLLQGHPSPWRGVLLLGLHGFSCLLMQHSLEYPSLHDVVSATL